MLLKLDLEQEKLDAKITGLILLILDRRSPGGIPKFTNRTVDPGGWNWSRVSSFGSAIQAVVVHVECERTCNDGKILCTVVNSALPLLCILLWPPLARVAPLISTRSHPQQIGHRMNLLQNRAATVHAHACVAFGPPFSILRASPRMPAGR